MGIAPKIWGPSAWAFIHLIPLAETDTFNPSDYQAFFQSLPKVLPCQACRNHLQENLSKLPSITSLKTKRELFDWTVKLHNLVNKITNKPEWSIQQAYDFWSGVVSGKNKLSDGICITNHYKYATYVLVVIVLFSMYWSMRPRRK